jgi:hypothetical protein
MYVQQSSACSVQNSLTPVSQASITAAQAALTSINTPATAAQAVFTALCNRTDLNTNGWQVAEYGGVPAGPSTSNPTQGYTTGLKSWPARKGVPACVSTAPTPEGAAPTSIASFAPPPGPAPSLVTQGHPSYSATAPKAAPAALCTQYVYGSIPYMNCLQTAQNSGVKLVGSGLSVYNRQTSGLGCTSESTGPSCDFLVGMVSAIGLAAAGLYLFDYFKRAGGPNF